MKINPIVILLRGTIFLNNKTIEYTKENQSSYAGLLSNSNISPIPTPPQFNSLSNVPWQIANKERAIVFLPNKIDILQRLAGDRTELESIFLDFCKETFKTILEKSDLKATRIAFAPTYVFESNENNIDEVPRFWQSVFKNIYVNDLPKKDINLSYLLKTEWEDFEKNSTVWVNLSHKWQDGTKTLTDGRTESCVILELDVNTVQSLETTFSINEIKEFYDWSLDCINKLMQNY